MVTSPTLAAPWSPTNQHLPIVLTHRMTFSCVRPTNAQLEQMEVATGQTAKNGSLRRSVSDGNSPRNGVAANTGPLCTTGGGVVLSHICGLSQPSIASGVNQSSSSSSLIEVSIAFVFKLVIASHCWGGGADENNMHVRLNRYSKPEDFLQRATPIPYISLMLDQPSLSLIIHAFRDALLRFH